MGRCHQAQVYRGTCGYFGCIGSKKRYSLIKTKPLHPSQKLLSKNAEDGSCIFQIEVVINFEMYSVFMSYGPGIKVIYPRQAVCYIKDKLREAANLYDTYIGEAKEDDSTT